MVQHRLEFRLSENPWAPTAVIEEINERTGAGLTLSGLSGQVGGSSSAAFARRPDGREVALTRTNISLERMQQTADVLNAMSDRGLPVPRHELVLPLSDGRVVVVQERLPGGQPDRVDIGMVDALVELNEQFRGVLADMPSVARPDAFPTVQPHWEQTLGRHSARTRRILDRIHELEGASLFQMSGDDLVHIDYSVENALFDESGKLTGIVDWNFGVARGDRRYSLLRLKSNVAGDYGASPEIVAHIDRILDTTLGAELLRTYSIHRAVYGVHHSIRNRLPPERIDSDLCTAESHLGIRRTM